MLLRCGQVGLVESKGFARLTAYGLESKPQAPNPSLQGLGLKARALRFLGFGFGYRDESFDLLFVCCFRHFGEGDRRFRGLGLYGGFRKL